MGELAVCLIYRRHWTPRVHQAVGMNELFDVKALNSFLWDIHFFLFSLFSLALKAHDAVLLGYQIQQR